MDLSVIVPTFNEGPNVAVRLRRTTDALADRAVEVIFVDDSTDDTPASSLRSRRTHAPGAPDPPRLPGGWTRWRRGRGHQGGGIRSTRRHGRRPAAPARVSPTCWCAPNVGDVDVVVASRYVAGGTSDGLANAVRTMASRASTLLTKSTRPKNPRQLRVSSCASFLGNIDLVKKGRRVLHHGAYRIGRGRRRCRRRRARPRPHGPAEFGAREQVGDHLGRALQVAVHDDASIGCRRLDALDHALHRVRPPGRRGGSGAPGCVRPPRPPG